MKGFKLLAVGAFVATSVLGAAGAMADGIVSTIVNSPLSAAGTVRDARVGINVYLQRADAPDMDFMDPKVVGYGIPAGGYLDVQMGDGFERDWQVGLSQAAIMLVTGAPQQGLPGKAVGYEVGQGADDRTFRVTPSGDKGLAAESLMSPVPGTKEDPVPQRGLKVLHIGFMQSAFFNRGDNGTVTVRLHDAAGKVVEEGSGTVPFLAAPVPQIQPTNFPDKMRNHNWQRVKAGDVLGRTAGTVPVTLLLYDKAPAGDAAKLHEFKSGLAGVGVLSTQQLKAMGYSKPAALARYTGGLIVQDSNGDGALSPDADRIVGGVIGAAPTGAKGQELRSLEQGGKPMLSQPSEAVVGKPGERWGGAIMTLQFTAGSAAGKYRPTLALLSNPDDIASRDGSSYTYTIIVD